MPNSLAQSPSPIIPAGQTSVPWTWTDLLFFIPLFAFLDILVSIPIIKLPVSTPVMSLLLTAGGYAGMLGAIYLLLHFRRRAPLSSLGLRLPKNRWWLLVPLPLTFFGLVLTTALEPVSQAIFPGAQSMQCPDIKSEFPPGPFTLLLAIVAVSLVAPFTEEIVFRGFIFGWLKAHLPTALALVFSGLIFGLAHGELLLIIPLGCFGIVLAYVYHRSGSLFPGMLTHALFNLVGILAILNSPC
jgi:hypothetical protein